MKFLTTLCLVLIFATATRAQVTDTIPPTLDLDLSDYYDFDQYEWLNDTTALIGFDCTTSFPVTDFEEPSVSDNIDPNPILTSTLSIDGITATMIWEAEDASGNKSRIVVINDYDGNSYVTAVDHVTVNSQDFYNDPDDQKYSASACPKQDVILTASASTQCPGALSYTWDLDGDNIADATGSEITYLWDKKDVYKIFVNAANTGFAGGSGSMSLEIEIGDPEFDILIKDNECKDDKEGRIEVMKIDSSITRIQIDQIETQFLENLGVGNHTVKVEFENGCKIDTIVEIGFTNEAKFEIQNTSINSWEGEDLVIINKTDPINSLEWNFGDYNQYSFSDDTIRYNYAMIGSYTVTLISETPNCSDELQQEIYVDWYEVCDEVIDTIPPVLTLSSLYYPKDPFSSRYPQYEWKNDTVFVSFECDADFPMTNFYEYEPSVSDNIDYYIDAVPPNCEIVNVEINLNSTLSIEGYTATMIWEATDFWGNKSRPLVVIHGFDGIPPSSSVDIIKVDGQEYTNNDSNDDKPIPPFACPNQEVLLSTGANSSCFGVFSYTWYLNGDNIADGSGSEISYSWEEKGVYNISVHASKNGTGPGGGARMDLEIKIGEPEYDILITDNECKDDKGGRIEVKNIDQSKTKIETQFLENLDVGNYTVEVESVNGCKIDTIVEIGYTNKARFEIQNEAINLSNNEELVVFNKTNPINQLVWDFGDGTQSSNAEDTIRHIYTDVGSYKVSLISNSPNCFDEFLQEVHVFDTVKPEIKITSLLSEYTNLDKIPIVIAVSKELDSFSEDNLSVTNGSMSDFSKDSLSYTCIIQSNKEGPIRVKVDENTVMDKHGNSNLVSNTFEIEYDITRPEVTFFVDNNENEGNNLIYIILSFSEPVIGLEMEDFTISGGIIEKIEEADGRYKIHISQGKSNDPIILTLRDETVKDRAGNPNERAEFVTQINALSDISNNLIIWVNKNTLFIKKPESSNYINFALYNSIGSMVTMKENYAFDRFELNNIVAGIYIVKAESSRESITKKILLE